ncbi:MAG: C39 family peptidase [Oscillatoriophycideae cyanobacterium NC_groundwater_1537_Pr4_S-0.65um_50_18]|nr:C39 family peptidase [Oscillatoriophycideae cyanobacterium NC_groundwater_1537_Pr4_S-0.65um_50_18]
MQIKVIKDTVFKQTTENAAQISPYDKIAVLAGRVFSIHSWKLVNQSHLSIALLGKFLGSPPRNTWYVYIPDVQLIRLSSIRVTQNTVFKQKPDSKQVSGAVSQQADEVAVAANTIFELQSWAIEGKYLKVALFDKFLGDPPRNTWYILLSQMQFINQQPQVVPIPQPPINPGGIPTTKRLNIPHKSQLDNAFNPTGACNVTSFAMAMAYFQIKQRIDVKQWEDELYLYMQNNNLSRWDANDLALMSRSYGLINDFTRRGKLSDLRKAIAEGRPCIIHGYFTSFGHIIVVRGYDPYGFFVNDPYGEWTSSGYRTDRSGANLHYSNALIQKKCSPEGEDYIWIHRLAKNQSFLKNIGTAVTTQLQRLTDKFTSNR